MDTNNNNNQDDSLQISHDSQENSFYKSNINDFKITKINTLALPKGQQPICELTGLMATVQLITKHITLFYATREHAKQAWEGIVYKIAPLLAPLRVTPPIIGSEEDREKRNIAIQGSKNALINLCQQEASKFLVAGKPHLAIPGAVQALSFAKDIFGDGSIDLVSCYLILAEANLGLGKFQMAEEFLAFANWSILKNPQCSKLVRSQLHRNFGKLYSAQGRLLDALKQLSQDIYYSSGELGPENVQTSPGYFLMGNIFYIQHKIENALAMYDKVVDIWYKFLANNNTGTSSKDNETGGQTTLVEAKINEGMDMLKKIYTKREKLLGLNHIATGEAKFTMGLLYKYMGDMSIAESYIHDAYVIYKEHLGMEHPSTIDVYKTLSDIQDGMNSNNHNHINNNLNHQSDGPQIDDDANIPTEITFEKPVAVVEMKKPLSKDGSSSEKSKEEQTVATDDDRVEGAS